MTDNLGIVFRNGRLLWGYRHGYAQRWPMWAKEAIVGGYNWIVCRLTQHDDHEWHLAENGLNWDDPGGCAHCGAVVRACTGWGFWHD